MLKNRLIYAAVLIGVFLFHCYYTGWLSWFLLMFLLLLPPFSLLCSLPCILRQQVAAQLPASCKRGEEVLLQISNRQRTRLPAPPCSLRLRCVDRLAGTELTEPMDEECSSTMWKGESLYYLRDWSFESGDLQGDLYCNGELVAENVAMYMGRSWLSDGQAAFLTDWNDRKETGTLQVFDGKKTQTIAEDVHCFETTKDGIAYLGEYSARRCEGDLYYFNGRKSVPVDQDVTQLYLVYDNGGSYDASWLGY